MRTGLATPSGIQFGPTSSGKMYLCARWHRGAGSPAHKTSWIIPEAEEYAVFCCADDQVWRDKPGNYWGIKNGEALGENDERVAKFPVPQNSHDPWHGYPVSTGKDKPPIKLINLWRDQSRITRALAKRMKQGKP